MHHLVRPRAHRSRLQFSILTRFGRWAVAAATTAVVGAASENAFAAKALKVVDGNVTLDLEGEPFAVGDVAFLMDGTKKRALVQITKVSGGRALGRVTKGTAVAGQTLRMAKPKASAASTSRKGRSRRARSNDGMLFGFVLGYAMDSQSVTVANTAGVAQETVSMSGGGFSAKAAVDLPIAGRVGLIGRFGAELFSLTGNSTRNVCASGKNCTTSITYASADMLIRYSLASGGFVPYVAGGLGIHFPVSKSSNILDENQVTTTTIFFAGGGFNIRVSDGLWWPIHVEYGLFPPSNSVSTSLIAARTGLLFAF